MSLPTYEQYQAELGLRLNWLEKLTDKATGVDERLDVLAKLQIEQLRILQTAFISPVLVTERISYLIRSFPLDNVRTDEEVSLSGGYISVSTDGNLNGMSIKFDTPTNDSISLLMFRNLSIRFSSLYLTNTAQSGKTLTIFIGAEASASGIVVTAEAEPGKVSNKSVWAHGQVDVASAGTAEELPYVIIPDGLYLTILAKPGNTGTIYLGKTKADAESATDRFDGLSAGLAHALKVVNANLVWVDASDDGDGVSWSVEQ